MSTQNESFREAQIEALRAAADANQLSKKDISFAQSLYDQYQRRNSLSEKQWYWVGKLLENAGVKYGTTTAGNEESTTEEIFDGKKILSLLTTASKELKFPRLRYATDGGSKIVFSFASADSKWRGCCFIDNGARGENKVRYGFITSNGQGNLNRTSSQEIKTAIRKIAADPVAAAKLSGQKFKNCCFCGLELLNKSSVYHGYGPICAAKWNLPWGDTGDIKDEEEAAAAEMKHIQLQDLE